MTDMVRADPGWPLWLPPTSEARVPDVLMGQALALIAAAQGRVIDEAGLIAYRMALSDVDPEDFVEGVKRSFKSVRFFTPAAVRECCEQARREREHAVYAERAAQERADAEAKRAEDERRREEQEARIAELLAAGRRGEALHAALTIRWPSIAWAACSIEVCAGRVVVLTDTIRRSAFDAYRAERAIEQLALELLGEKLAVEISLSGTEAPA
jgi:hypothetical protein